MESLSERMASGRDLRGENRNGVYPLSDASRVSQDDYHRASDSSMDARS